MNAESRERQIIACLHPYLEARRKEIESRLYPKHHFWGIDKIEQEDNFISSTIFPESVRIPPVIEKLLNRVLFRGSPGVKAEIASIQAARKADLIYSVCGPLFLNHRFQRAKLVSWVFRPIEPSSSSLLNAYNEKCLRAHSGFLCLTPKAEEFYSQFAPSKFIPWCVDMDMFDGLEVNGENEKPFFLANGKTGRDYHTFVKGCIGMDAEVRIIGPKQEKPDSLPENVNWIETSEDPPDQAVNYPTLKKWYSQCIGVCIPLSGDADDTCGYTNMLEAMAMKKPVLMTKSGSLHIDPETDNFGKNITPKDCIGWKNAMNEILLDQGLARKFGEEGRRLAKSHFTTERFNRDVLEFLMERLACP